MAGWEVIGASNRLVSDTVAPPPKRGQPLLQFAGSAGSRTRWGSPQGRIDVTSSLKPAISPQSLALRAWAFQPTFCPTPSPRPKLPSPLRPASAPSASTVTCTSTPSSDEPGRLHEPLPRVLPLPLLWPGSEPDHQVDLCPWSRARLRLTPFPSPCQPGPHPPKCSSTTCASVPATTNDPDTPSPVLSPALNLQVPGTLNSRPPDQVQQQILGVAAHAKNLYFVISLRLTQKEAIAPELAASGPLSLAPKHLPPL